MERPFRLEANQATALKLQFGTPLYVVSEVAFTERIQSFQSALALIGGAGRTRMSYATKANSTLALLQIAHRNGCHIDVASEGELRAAMLAGIPAQDCTLHGNNKSEQELRFAIDQGIGEIVIDSFDEITRLVKLGQSGPQLTLRVNPRIDLDLNPKVATASRLSKFGFALNVSEIKQAVEALHEAGLNVTGLHCHLGSQIVRPNAHAKAATLLLSVMAELPDNDWQLLNLGGGFGIRYTNEDPPTFAECLENVAAVDIPAHLTVAFEPGRSLIAEAGLTLYTAGTIKTVDEARIIAVDGGLADNPRPALYDSRYRVEGFIGGDEELFTIVGRHCENDVLHPDVSLPRAIHVDDLVQILCTGAYSSSMASNYNRYPRPGTVLISQAGEPRLVQKRETYDEMFSREVLL